MKIIVDTCEDDHGQERIVDGVICGTYDVLAVGAERHKVVGPDPEDLINLASCFSTEEVTSLSRAVEALNFAAAYGEQGEDTIGLFV